MFRILERCHILKAADAEEKWIKRYGRDGKLVNVRRRMSVYRPFVYYNPRRGRWQ